MNKRKALELLAQYLKTYGGSGDFYFHQEFMKELGDIVTGYAAGHETEVFHIMIKQFGFVKAMGVRVNEADSNEILKNTGGEKEYYSLHIQDKIVNIRMLMTFMDSGIPVFLAVFFERAGKKVSDYSRWVSIIKERYQQITGE